MRRKRLEKATFLASYGRKSRNETPTPLGNLRDGQVIDLQGTRNTCKALIVKARLPFAPIAFNVLISDHEYFPKPTFSNSFQRAMNLSGEAIVFELPPYTQMVRINSYPINITEYEITVVELDPPIYHNFSKKNEINNYTSKSKDISPEEKSVDKIIGDGFVPRQKPTMDWFGSKINLSTF